MSNKDSWFMSGEAVKNTNMYIDESEMNIFLFIKYKWINLFEITQKNRLI